MKDHKTTPGKPDIPHPMTIIDEALQSLDITVEHSAQSVSEVQYWLENDGLDDAQLVELTEIPFVTMDNEDSRDLDQALFIERDGEGYRVMYALADASYYIRPGSALFDEALERGTTYYTPLMAAAMLPVELSEGLISLNPDALRRSLVFDMRLDALGAVSNCQIVRARIRSKAKLSYGGVQSWLDNDMGKGPDTDTDTDTDSDSDTDTDTDDETGTGTCSGTGFGPQAESVDETDQCSYHPSLRLLKELGIKLVAAGETRGVIRFDRTETRIHLAGTPPRLQASLRSRYDTERYNEQLSLICNMQGAELLLGLAGVTDVLQAVFRIHEAPLQKSLNRLKKTLNTLATTYPDSEKWRWQEGQSLAQYVDSLPDDVQHERRVRAIQRQIMMAQRGSTFTPEPGEHHALKACSYARFSSPMREVVGIFTHKELIEALSGSRFDNDSDHALREKVIDSANKARQRQRQLDKKIEFAALLSVFSHELKNENARWHSGTIMGMRADKIYVNLDDMALDVKVYLDDLEAAFSTHYVIDDTKAQPDDASLPLWQLGQGIKLRISSYDNARARFVFSMQSIE